MFTTVLSSFLETIRMLLKNRTTLAIFAALYALLLATLYGFVSTREASVWQVLVTLFFLVLIPAEFFILQATIVDHTRGQGLNWGRILRDSCKLAVVTIPIILLGYVLFVLLNKWQLHFPQPKPVLTLPTSHGPTKPEPLHWPTLLFATLRCLLFGVVLPLATIHLWIEVAGREVRALVDGGAKAILKRVGQVLARAFAVESALTYALGLVVFVLIPYAILFVPVSVKGTKTDFAVFIVRLVLGFAFTLIGWVVTLRALVENRGGAPQAPRKIAPGVSAEDNISGLLSPQRSLSEK
jgi:hypothetical protein